MDLQLIDRVKRLTIIALVSDDSLMERLFLKGGNALDLIHGVSHRASMDIGFSLAGDFATDERATLEGRFRQLLETTFGEHGLRVFDVRFAPMLPSRVRFPQTWRTSGADTGWSSK